MNIKRIIKSELLFESQEERLRGAYQKWCKKVKLNNKYQRDEITDIDGYIEELGRYSYDFEDPYSKTYKKTEELYSKGDYEGVHKLVVEYECGVELIDRKFKEWSSYRNQMPTSDIFQYKSENELYIELQKAKEKSFTKKLKKSKEGKDFEKIYEDEDMVIIVPLTHVGACKYGQGTRWCTASKVKPEHFEGYDEEGNLYRVLQKNDKLIKNPDIVELTDRGNHRNRNPKHMDKVSIHLKYTGEKSMVDSIDNYYGEIDVGYFLAELPDNAVNTIKQYQSEH